jgi:hypothetical protein
MVPQSHRPFDFENAAKSVDLVHKALNVLVCPPDADRALEKGVVGL